MNLPPEKKTATDILATDIMVLIPALNAADTLGDLLADIARAPGFTPLVVDGGSCDGTQAIARTGATLIETKAGRGHQICTGLKQLKTGWVLILHADSRISPQALAAARTFTRSFTRSFTPPNTPAREDPQKAGYFKLRFRNETLMAALVAYAANLRSSLFGLPYGDQGLLISARLLTQTGGYPDLPLMEDVALARRLGRKRLHCLGPGLTTSAAKYETRGWFRRIFIHLYCLILFYLKKDPADILKRYR